MNMCIYNLIATFHREKVAKMRKTPSHFGFFYTEYVVSIRASQKGLWNAIVIMHKKILLFYPS